MRRRTFSRVVVSATFAIPFLARAQSKPTRPRIGYFGGGDSANRGYLNAVLQPMQKLGWIDGQTIDIEYRFMQGQLDRLPDVVQDFREKRVALMWTDWGVAAIQANKIAPGIPLVTSFHVNPVAVGLAETLSHPGRNVTGFFQQTNDLICKSLSLLREIAPGIARVGFLYADYITANVLAENLAPAKSFAASTGLGFETLSYSRAEEIAPILERVQGGPDLGLLDLLDAVSYSEQGQRLIPAEVLRRRVPTVMPTDRMVAAGGLLALTLTGEEDGAVIANRIDLILHGARAGDLPIGLPTKFWLVVNSKTAAALGLVIPNTILVDQVIA